MNWLFFLLSENKNDPFSYQSAKVVCIYRFIRHWVESSFGIVWLLNSNIYCVCSMCSEPRVYK